MRVQMNKNKELRLNTTTMKQFKITSVQLDYQLNKRSDSNNNKNYFSLP